MQNDKFTSNPFHQALLVIFFIILVWSGIQPKDYYTWILEVLPALLGLIALALTYQKFRLTNLTYFLIWCQAVILVIGGHYTYAEMPLFNWMRDTFDLDRNYYDRLGHFAQGFVPAMISREILLRTTSLKPGKMLAFLIVSVCLSISAFYEFIEWWVAIASGTAAEAFLGTQGDVWDTQWDMFMAFCGAILSLLFLSRRHDKGLKLLEEQN